VSEGGEDRDEKPIEKQFVCIDSLISRGNMQSYIAMHRVVDKTLEISNV
jgi:hypothetical protein